MMSFSSNMAGNCTRTSVTNATVSLTLAPPFLRHVGGIDRERIRTDDGTSSASNCPSSSWRRRDRVLRERASAREVRRGPWQAAGRAAFARKTHLLHVRQVLDHVLPHVLRPIDQHVRLQVLQARHAQHRNSAAAHNHTRSGQPPHSQARRPVTAGPSSAPSYSAPARKLPQRRLWLPAHLEDLLHIVLGQVGLGHRPRVLDRHDWLSRTMAAAHQCSRLRHPLR